MELFSILSLLMLLSACAAKTTTAPLPEAHFKRHFNALSTKRYPKYEGGVPWTNARKYIIGTMKEYGVRLIEQQIFNTTVGGDEFEGVNIIGVAEGNNPKGPVVVVGADYDTALLSNPLKNNAGGVACLLETIHWFLDTVYWNYHALNYTVVFVAFDLNTREYLGSDMGKPGSYFFIHEWLIPFLEENEVEDFRGAVILDSVTTYNTENDTQVLRNGFEEAMPDADAEIKENGMRGDFLGFLYTTGEKLNPLKEAFISSYHKGHVKKQEFRLQEMELHLSFETVRDDVIDLFNHQSHYFFWTSADEKNLPSFLLFDTDGDRTDGAPAACDPVTCSVELFLTEERLNFMGNTTHALYSALLDLQTTKFEPTPSAGTIPASKTILITFVPWIVVAFFLKH